MTVHALALTSARPLKITSMLVKMHAIIPPAVARRIGPREPSGRSIIHILPPWLNRVCGTRIV